MRMEGMSAFAGVYGREMRPQRRHMEIALFKAARFGDVQAFLKSLFSCNYEATVVINTEGDHATLPAAAAAEESQEMIFGVTVGGNTVLHIAARHGHLDLAREICCLEPSLVAAVNTRLETPLHCCAREGHEDIVSLIINTARSCRNEGADHGWLDVLRARNVHGETALHEASRSGHAQVAEKLIAADSELASFVSKGMSTTPSPADNDMIKDAADHKQLIYSADHYDAAGLPFHVNDTSMSPLYLAVMKRSKSTVEALLQHDSSSFAGPGGRTALHAAAVTRCPEITTMLLKWKPELGRVVDESHSTPLHYVATDDDREMARILLKHDPSTAYISDKDGYFPIHVAARMNRVFVIWEILDQCPDSFELVDHKGRSFLHLAVERIHCFLVMDFILNLRLKSKRGFKMLLNQRDNFGDTPMHQLVVSLHKTHNWPSDQLIKSLKNISANLSIMNNQGLMPLDPCIVTLKSKSGWEDKDKDNKAVTRMLVQFGAIMSPCRIDHVQLNDEAFNEELKKYKSIAKNVAIVSVLIATVTFAAGFTIPGGYKSDDGTSIMANKYPFKVFLISNAFALLLSLIATMQIIFFGTSSMDISLQKRQLDRSLIMLGCSIAYMCMSFGMATLVIIAPKDRRIAFLVCILSLVAPFIYMDFLNYLSLEPLERFIMLTQLKLTLGKIMSRRQKQFLTSKSAFLMDFIQGFTSRRPSRLFLPILYLYIIVFLLAFV